MSDPKDERYATFREHAELRERTATLEATVLQIGPTLSRIETMVAAKNTPAVDHTALASHRAIETLPTAMAAAFKEIKQGGSNANPLLISLGTIIALAVGFVVAKFF